MIFLDGNEECVLPMKKEVTVVVIQDGQTLLGMDEEGRSQGLWTSPQGKVQPGQTRQGVALQIVQDVIGQDVAEEDVVETGRLHWVLDNMDVESCHQEVISYVFRLSLDGQTEKTQLLQSKFQWFPTNNLPWDKMWSDNQLWLPIAINKAGYFVGKANFANGSAGAKDFELKFCPRKLEKSLSF
jgi:8-oxo-dGTP diphosphatase